MFFFHVKMPKNEIDQPSGHVVCVVKASMKKDFWTYTLESVTRVSLMRFENKPSAFIIAYMNTFAYIIHIPLIRLRIPSAWRIFVI